MMADESKGVARNAPAPILNGDDTDFYKQVADLLAAARQYAKRQLDSTITITYFEVGRMIVEREQRGQKRAQYGARLIKGLSAHLTEQLGKGYSVPTLKNIRQFYLVYSPTIKSYSPISLSVRADEDEKSYSLISLFDYAQKQQSMSAKSAISQKGQSLADLFKISWTHYQCCSICQAAKRFLHKHPRR